MISAEACVAYHIIKHHQSFASANCLSKLFPKIYDDSTTEKKNSAAATKSNAIITKALAPHSIESVLIELEECMFYSISTDASNHKAEKMLPLVVQYFTTTGTKVKLLKLGNLKGETSEIIADFCIESIWSLQIDVPKCIAFSSDNTNTNFGGRARMGKNNVFTRLKATFGSQIQGIGCPAHILHNAIQTAADQLSCDVDQIVAKVFNYFSIFTVRTEQLKDFCDFVSIGYKKLKSHSKTRWLSLLPVVERFLTIFEGLK